MGAILNCFDFILCSSLFCSIFRSIKDEEIENEEPSEVDQEAKFSEIKRLEEQMLEFLNNEEKNRDIQNNVYSREYLYLIRNVVKVWLFWSK